MSHPLLKTSIPGPQSKKLIRKLHRFECPHITYADQDFPVFWEKAQGRTVTDVDGNSFVDLTAAFAVCNLGHSPAVLKASIKRQVEKGWHAMGDVHPHRTKLECAEAITGFLPGDLSQVIFSSSGSEAVESALKTALLYTARPGVMAFEGGYHGLGYGALQVTHREWFRKSFRKQSGNFVHFKKFIEEGAHDAKSVKNYLKVLARFIHSKRKTLGAVIIEPIQGRAGMRVADKTFLQGLRGITKNEKILLIFDEIFTGWGRTGRWFSFEHYDVIPDVITLGKGMANGFPISACVASPKIMRAWGPSPGEAKHTSTFLGNPLGAVMTTQTLRELRRGNYLNRVQVAGDYLKRQLETLKEKRPHRVKSVRGKGLMLGLEFHRKKEASHIMKKLLKEGVITLSSGENSETLSFTPPFTIKRSEIDFALRALDKML